MNLLKTKIGQIASLGLPKGRHKLELQMENGKVTGGDLPTVAAVESIIRQAEEMPETHLESDGPNTWYDGWSQKHDRNNWGRDIDDSRFRSLRVREIGKENSVVAEATGTPWIPEFPGISELVPNSFSAQDTQGYLSMEYKWENEQIKSIHERRSFPGQPIEELNLTVGDDGKILLETSVEEFRIP